MRDFIKFSSQNRLVTVAVSLMVECVCDQIDGLLLPNGLILSMTSDRSSVMNRSTAQRITPAGLNVFTVLYDAWDSRIAA